MLKLADTFPARLAVTVTEPGVLLRVIRFHVSPLESVVVEVLASVLASLAFQFTVVPATGLPNESVTLAPSVSAPIPAVLPI